MPRPGFGRDVAAQQLQGLCEKQLKIRSILTRAALAHTTSGLCGPGRDRVAVAQRLCHQASWRGQLPQANGRTLRGRHIYRELEQGQAKANVLGTRKATDVVLSLQYADPVLDKLDVHKVVAHRLFRESCYNHKGSYVKVGRYKCMWMFCCGLPTRTII